MKRLHFLLLVALSPLPLYPEETPSTPAQPIYRSLKDKYNIAKLVITKGTSGITEVVKEKLHEGAGAAKNAIAASIEQTQITIERAKADYAEQQLIELKKELLAAQEEIKNLKKQLAYFQDR